MNYKNLVKFALYVLFIISVIISTTITVKSINDNEGSDLFITALVWCMSNIPTGLVIVFLYSITNNEE